MIEKKNGNRAADVDEEVATCKGTAEAAEVVDVVVAPFEEGTPTETMMASKGFDSKQTSNQPSI